MQDKVIKFEDDITLILQDDDAFHDLMLSNKIAEYLSEHPNSHNGTDISSLVKYVRPILVKTPTIAASAVIYKSIKQH